MEFSKKSLILNSYINFFPKAKAYSVTSHRPVWIPTTKFDNKI